MRIVGLDSSNLEKVEAETQPANLLPHHHPGWMVILRALGEDCRGLVAVENGRILGWILYVVRAGPYGTVVTSLPYIAYGGPAVPNGDTTVLTALIQGLRKEAELLRADVLTIGTSPLISPEVETLYRKTLEPSHEFENFVQVQDLSVHPLQQLTSKRRAAIRSEMSRAARHGLRIIRELTPEQLHEWLCIYNKRYTEISAQPYPDPFHQSAFSLGVPAKFVEFWGVRDGQRLVGGVMFTLSGNTVDYFSSAFDSEYRHLYPNTFLLNEALADFMNRGIRRFNWQSSPNKGGVYQYKARWGAREWRHYYLAVLLRPDTKLLETPTSDIRRAYPFRFVLPFSAWTVNSSAQLTSPT
jgi:Acetyltransferase (GNAT) domain